MYFAYHMDDTTRPPDMQTIDASEPEVMLDQLHRIMRRIYEKMPEEVKSAMALLNDKVWCFYPLDSFLSVLLFIYSKNFPVCHQLRTTAHGRQPHRGH